MVRPDSRFSTSQSRFSTSQSRFSTSQSRFSTSQSRFSTSQSRFSTSQSRFSTSQSRFSTSQSRFSTSQSRFSTSQSRFSTSQSHGLWIIGRRITRRLSRGVRLGAELALRRYDDRILLDSSTSSNQPFHTLGERAPDNETTQSRCKTGRRAHVEKIRRSNPAGLEYLFEPKPFHTLGERANYSRNRCWHRIIAHGSCVFDYCTIVRRIHSSSIRPFTTLLVFHITIRLKKINGEKLWANPFLSYAGREDENVFL